jgi:hypothetical protein
MDPAFEQEHLGNFAQMQILVILPNSGCLFAIDICSPRLKVFSSQGL